jgi:dephospho-CoA kinase
MQNNSQQKTYIIGLTGGIGSGKSTISTMFAQLGADIIDADEISRQLVEKDSPMFEKIVAHFGKKILRPSGDLDRTALREIIFSRPQEKKWLEALLHPAIKDEIQYRITQSTGAYIILVVPLLVEQRKSGHYNFIDRILVIDVPEEIQIKRIIQRDGSSEELIRQIISSQASQQQRLSFADDIIDNRDQADASEKNLQHQIKQLHRYYLKLTMSAS